MGKKPTEITYSNGVYKIVPFHVPEMEFENPNADKSNVIFK